MKPNPLTLPILLAMLGNPYHAVSKPVVQVWAHLKRFKLPRWSGLGVSLRLALASELGETKTESKATELREEAAAKYKEAKAYIDEEVEKAGKTEADLNADDSFLEDSVLEKFDAIMAEGESLRVKFEKAAKAEGRWPNLKDNLDFFHGTATGKPVPWGQITTQEYQEPRKTLGEQFTTSETYRELIKSGILHSEKAKFITERIAETGDYSDLVETQRAAVEGDTDAQRKLAGMMKAASDIIHTGSGAEGDALVLDQFLPGIIRLPQRPLTVRGLFASGRATSDTVSYAAQLNFDTGAAMVSQATGTGDGAKPQSSIRWERRTRPVETLATYMAATRQQMADAPQVESLIDNQGRLMLQLVEEDQLLSGTGASPQLQGVLSETGVQTFDVLNGADSDVGHLNNLKAIRTARRMVATGGARMAADAIILHPNDSEEYDLSVDSNGLFRGGNPVGNFGFNQTLWGLRRVESEAIAEGTALVGAFQTGATVLERMPITVYTTDSHDDWFIRNLIAVLFEERFGFPIFYPAAFVNMTLAGWEGGS